MRQQAARTEAVAADTVRADGERKWFMVDSLLDATTVPRAEVPVEGGTTKRTFVRDRL
ncbi:hypothetical protein STENM36S_01866 [Streptomyces tendae]